MEAPAGEPCAALRALLSQHDVLAKLLTQLDPPSLACAACVCTDMRAASMRAWVAVRARHWPHAAVALQFRAGAPTPTANAPPAHKVCAAYGAAAADAGAQPRPVPPLDLKTLRLSVCITRADGDRAVVYAGTMHGVKFDAANNGTCELDAEVPLASAWSVPWDQVGKAALVASLFVERRRTCTAGNHVTFVNEVACLFTGRAGRLRTYQDASDEYDSEDELSDDCMQHAMRTFLFTFSGKADRYQDIHQLLPVAPAAEGAWYGRINLKLRLMFAAPEAQPAAKSRADGEDDGDWPEEDEYLAFQRAARVPSTPRMRASLMFMQEFDREWGYNPRCGCRFSDGGRPEPEPMKSATTKCVCAGQPVVARAVKRRSGGHAGARVRRCACTRRGARPS
jgi:hypothetical protein